MILILSKKQEAVVLLREQSIMENWWNTSRMGAIRCTYLEVDAI